RLVVEDGASVLWATHLIDEVSNDDDVIVLHQGRVLAHGSVSRVVEAAAAQDIRVAFTRLTQGADAAIGAPRPSNWPRFPACPGLRRPATASAVRGPLGAK